MTFYDNRCPFGILVVINGVDLIFSKEGGNYQESIQSS